MFVVPDTLMTALAMASPDELRGLAARWSEFLVTVEDELSSGDLVTVVQGVARLAVAATESVGRLRLYCWQY